MTDSRAKALAQHLRQTRTNMRQQEEQELVTQELRALGYLPEASQKAPGSPQERISPSLPVPGADLVQEGKKTKSGHNPTTVQRCVASMLNKGETDGAQDDSEISKTEKSKAYAVCWAQQNKGALTKGFQGNKGATRKDQYKASLKNKED